MSGVKDLSFLLKIPILIFLLYLVFPLSAYAYLDPGTGSYIIQIIIASLAGGAYLIAVFRDKIRAFITGLFSRLLKRPKDEESK